MTLQARPKDGMFSRFTGPVMTQICALTPDFNNQYDANAFYRRMRRYKRFHQMVANQQLNAPLAPALPDEITCSGSAYRCTLQATMGEINLANNDCLRQNPMDLLHIVAHFLQPAGKPWHGGEFGGIFLDLVERMFDKDIKRAAKDIMIANKIKTSVRSAGTREKQSAAFYRRKVEKAPAGLAKILSEMRELRSLGKEEDDDDGGS